MNVVHWIALSAVKGFFTSLKPKIKRLQCLRFFIKLIWQFTFSIFEADDARRAV